MSGMSGVGWSGVVLGQGGLLGHVTSSSSVDWCSTPSHGQSRRTCSTHTDTHRVKQLAAPDSLVGPVTLDLQLLLA